jgi:hypothetical protein
MLITCDMIGELKKEDFYLDKKKVIDKHLDNVRVFLSCKIVKILHHDLSRSQNPEKKNMLDQLESYADIIYQNTKHKMLESARAEVKNNNDKWAEEPHEASLAKRLEPMSVAIKRAQKMIYIRDLLNPKEEDLLFKALKVLEPLSRSPGREY